MTDKKNDSSNVIDLASRRKVLIQAPPITPNMTGVFKTKVEIVTPDAKPIDLQKYRKVKSQKKAFDFFVEASELDEKGKLDESIALYTKAIALDPLYHAAYVNLGNCFYRKGDDKKATSLYLRALEINGTNAEAHYNLGYVLFEKDKYEDAIPHFIRTIRIDKKFADAHFDLAMCYEQTGRRAMAKPYWETYLKLMSVKPKKEDLKYVAIAKEYLGKS